MAFGKKNQCNGYAFSKDIVWFFRAYKIATPSQKKTRRGGNFRRINTCGKVPLQVNFLDNDIDIAFYLSNLSTEVSFFSLIGHHKIQYIRNFNIRPLILTCSIFSPSPLSLPNIFIRRSQSALSVIHAEHLKLV